MSRKDDKRLMIEVTELCIAEYFKCRYADKYKGFRAPQCGCTTCEEIWEKATSGVRQTSAN